MFGYRALLRLPAAGSLASSPLHGSLIGLASTAPAAKSPFLSQPTLSLAAVPTPSTSTHQSSFLLQAMRGSKYPSYGGKRLRGYILPKQSEKTAILKKMLKMKWFRIRKGSTGQRPKKPLYGRDDFILGKMNV
ncbi:hypothetical protein BATDEDRAFT_24315 [Batrachochytrium dendrobatidis JAM81]|uniref:Uncharacterized protein n=2 Tax=Batrachochytrium dendrobatidis TaxID=109871 RepID=F4P2C7_BATDJ|nr:uncharacterized protein BATDEDRAFT_24315 [Batrachochytrium dendrobatidis JAM81]EGF80858.1 hypothetical protein BATDEDRAFT_24315 [Batrachochytrium dendrobatidis JAM81]KAJ8329239.1 hypothetical protein O5D80_002584 [Batrachochytrium dendrobatidis]KAK5664516.1 hypothetical protein QVD99_008692 [Batrachochytrium dendrobatidis]OAJ41464.1 hypothetical protein BDEG_25055 [Batrachochytrium dendrobatidis JEL423]|eukprot:XP_006678406.1 hypothetical protein BATDEDRAFT_24315 [Batrachochytrium dendrobatidis JAM81]